ncbi:putative transposase [Haloferax volcanii DS2]|uniref:Putative transposase n=1 Tax=Haloferax volcanii (strain ATCC 29605 / DSM 3757 / JCM 8879 / NBRC 14742 / NCIMB 2012 / VKM B-1768 / DS2) TaxID=309800 RepID=L9V328_HALVD|nr:putative transposase [Haloferax volcanii DS2]
MFGMKPADLLSEYFATDLKETWERERTAILVRSFAVQLHTTGCSLREIKQILRYLGIERSHQAV